MTRCVPPGSVLGILGPVLFDILVNELMMGQTVLSEIFADDNKLGGVADNTRVSCCHSEGPEQAGEMEKQKPHEA